MTTGGWINMLLSVGFVTTLFVFCIARVMRGPRRDADHQLAHVEPIEEDEADQR
ncbi:MAG: hypothetical protein H7A44_06235 [Opitutaceae bacterium]|jgi:hypothetical protein|nr:hypothetical protein [Cephaloticoccus sp.]MCP5530021.1 hypothetical protein [Opitutaceae bacterium]